MPTATSQTGIWKKKYITKNELQMGSGNSHGGLNIPKEVWSKVKSLKTCKIFLNGILVDGVELTQHSQRPYEVRIQATKPLKEMGLRDGKALFGRTPQGLEIKQPSVQAWLMSVSALRSHHEANRRDGTPFTSISWDSRVFRHTLVKPGHVIVLHDSNGLVGLSFIEKIVKSETTGVRTYEAETEVWWRDLSGLMGADELGNLVGEELTQKKFLRLDWRKFRDPLSHKGVDLTDIPAVGGRLSFSMGDGHTYTMTKTRRGQAKFREDLLNEFGEICIFTGPQPRDTLQAAHLYSWAKVGKHEDHGGLLMRADLHLLFDKGLIGIDMSSATPKIWLHKRLDKFKKPHYLAQLDGKPVASSADLDKRKTWLDLHQEEHKN